jgi:hypothetical protein
MHNRVFIPINRSSAETRVPIIKAFQFTGDISFISGLTHVSHNDSLLFPQKVGFETTKCGI